jgi:YVTN family beta-propeller protein
MKSLFPRATVALLSLAAGTTFAGAQAPTVEKSAKFGDGLYEIVASGKTDMIWVAAAGARDRSPATIYGLDANSLEVKKTIDMTAAPAYGLGINDATQTLYTSNTRAGNVSAIDLATGKVVATIGIEAKPKAHVMDVLVDEATNTVYVSIAENPASVWVIDGKTNTLKTVIDSLGTTATGIAVDNATKTLYVASMGTNEILAVDLDTKKVTRRIPTDGQRSSKLAYDAKGGRLFVTNQGSGDISVIDVKAGSVVRKVATGAGALGIDFDATTNRIFVANRQAGTVTIVDGTTYAVAANLPAGSLPNTIAVDPRGRAAYVTSKAKSGGRGGPAVVDDNGDIVTRIKW